ncbi:biotin synthase [Phenylobacterium sp. Root77]|uniref:biotin synthase BioB n=1 Tax=unclassified Phenylobacterium TaxID=2640670 RepID=UPI0006F8ED89|nr:MULTISPECIES: biotin synthase BioB [unclassified Phenylobacterium]KQW72240.1 biotin synthase [Phenylobacterium sp. Root1277]KQW95159.1 biotin synthase [Phenylobacterium sp. Root1290]KRC44852.1 biotin synthase [Phenylobacterium sp. Root77]
MNAPTAFRSFDPAEPRHDWTLTEVEALFELPFMELVFRAAEVHRATFDPSEVQLAQLLSVKTGGCPENCGYCSQSQHFETGVSASKLVDATTVIAEAMQAKAGGAQRFCMGAAWRDLKDRDVPKVAALISGVKALGLETCATLGMMTRDQAQALKDAGLDYYSHNLDTGPDYYDKVVTTRTYQERLDTLEAVRSVGMSTCCGGIVGMGETRKDRVGLLHALATLPEHPGSLPINDLVPIPGTPLGDSTPVDPLEFVRMIAVARIVCPKSVVRLAAGREHMSRELQALCFLAGANSMFIGAKLLTAAHPDKDSNASLLADLGLRPMTMATGA